MKALRFTSPGAASRFGLKGRGAAIWLAAHALPVPEAPNTWAGAGPADDAGILVARLGAAEFFLEEAAAGSALRGIDPGSTPPGSGVYPVLREDAAYSLSGQGASDVLAQVCNVNFADLNLDPHPVIMTSMIGVSVLVIPQDSGSERIYRIWCDPTFGTYLGESLRMVVSECGGNNMGVSA